MKLLNAREQRIYIYNINIKERLYFETKIKNPNLKISLNDLI
jgi:hypothetical protein